MRFLKPQCQLNPNWCEEDLLVAARRALSIIHDATVPKQGSHLHSQHTRLSAPAFSYCFPFLKCVLKDGGKAVDGDEDIQQLALQVFGEHCKLRSDKSHHEVDEVSDISRYYLTTISLTENLSSSQICLNQNKRKVILSLHVAKVEYPAPYLNREIWKCYF